MGGFIKKQSKLKAGDLVVIHFKDHCFANFSRSNPVPIKCPGFFIEECDDHYKIETFASDIGPTEAPIHHGDSYTVVKHPGVWIEKATGTKRVC